MSRVDRLRAFSTPTLLLFVVSKCIIWLGAGVLLANVLAGLGWWIVGLGIVLSISGWIKILR